MIAMTIVATLSAVDTFIQIGIALLVVFIVCLIMFGGMGVVKAFNEFQIQRQGVSESLSSIGIMTQKRYDLLLSLVQIVKKYNLHENTTLRETISARQFNTQAKLSEQVTQISALQDSMVKIQALIEQYPTLKADALHSQVMGRNYELEFLIQQQRQTYNFRVREYNILCKKFPSNIIAKMFRYSTLSFLSFEDQRPYDPRTIYAEF